MVEKTYTVEFVEQSKGVIARTKIEGNSETYDELLDEAKTLFEEAHSFAHKLTLRKTLPKQQASRY